jgi:glycosyltransferase involved in cell wall biosynthesis
MNLHLLAFPHTETVAGYETCAYTAKARNASRMFTDAGHTVYLYGGERNDASCHEHIPVVSDAERVGWFGEWDANRMPGLGWAPSDQWWRLFNARAIIAIAARAEPKDIILCSTGWAQKPIADAFPELLSVEYGVGYEGICLNQCAFESYAWMHHVYGLRGIQDGRNYDAVIPNFFDPDDFTLGGGGGGGGYLLFLGRVTHRKGVKEAIEIAKHSGMRLVVAGPTSSSRGAVDEVDLSGCEYVGPASPSERRELLANAVALLAPTRYLEPFGGVVAEAFMSGTPAITTDWGNFPEMNETGVTGFRIRNLAEGVAAVEACRGLDRTAIRARAVSRYSLAAVAPQYDAWFARLDALWEGGWYEKPIPRAAEAAA